MLESYLAIPPLLGVLGLLVALGIYIVVTRFPEGDEKVKKIGDQIHLGAMTFMKTEYTYLSIFALVVIVLVWFSLGEATAYRGTGRCTVLLYSRLDRNVFSNKSQC